MLPRVLAFYASLYRANVTVDFVRPEADLAGYRLVVAPNLYLVNDRTVENLNHYVSNGGTLVMSFFSGIVDENEHIRLGKYPAPFRAMLGLGIKEYVAFAAAQTNALDTVDGSRFGCSLWSDVAQTEGAEVIASYVEDYFAGCPAITRNRFGRGTAYYIGTAPDKDSMDWLLRRAREPAGTQPIVSNAPAGVECVRRIAGSQTWLFVLNYSSERAGITLEQPWLDLLNGQGEDGMLYLEPGGVAVLQPV